MKADCDRSARVMAMLVSWRSHVFLFGFGISPALITALVGSFLRLRLIE
ncbi:hypothetical protein [Candidatus Villigracilis saccharophilus]|jgi:hypothetical protein|nr:hypothetical protein [Anaerolineales bacterium]